MKAEEVKHQQGSPGRVKSCTREGAIMHRQNLRIYAQLAQFCIFWKKKWRKCGDKLFVFISFVQLWYCMLTLMRFAISWA